MTEWEFSGAHASHEDAETTFAALAEHVVGSLLARSPVEATWLGEHAFDGRLGDLSDESATEELTNLDHALGAIDQVDDVALGTESSTDLEILRARLAGERLAIGTIEERRWNPLVANPGTALHLLLARDFAPLPERLRAVASRLAAVPEHLETARSVLGGMPRVHAETAVGQFLGTQHLIDEILESSLEEVPSLRSELDPLRREASAAIEAHVGWLRDRIESDQCTRDPRLGEELYAAKLWATLDAHLTPDDVLHRAEEHLARVEGDIARLAARYLGEPVPPPDDAAAVVRRALEAVATAGQVDDTTVLDLCRRALRSTHDFVAQHELVTQYDDPVEIVEMPEIHRGVAVAYCDAPGPLETAPLPTFFAVAPTPSDWPAERVTSFYREYNAHMLHNLSVHEAMPGHVLQLEHSRRLRSGSVVRRTFQDGAFVEGWAVYAEQLMVERGYAPADAVDRDRAALAIALQQLKMQLRMTVNAILDVRVHARGMTEDEAMRLMRVRGFQEEGEAVGKWRRALLTSTQLSTYFVGFLGVCDVVSDVRAAHPSWSDRQVNDAVLAHGSPPARHLRTLLGL